MKNRYFAKLKYVILGALFLVTAVITFVSMNYQSALPSTTTMTEATLPIVMMETEEGTLFNQLHGYTSNVEESLLNDSITPLPSDKKLPIVIHTYDQNVTGISYKVRDMNDMSLIENTVVSDYTQGDEQVTARLNIKNLIEDNKEYMLQIIIKTDDHENISYYTKIIGGTDYHLQDKLNFVMDFNACTFDQNRLNSISKYIETNASGINGNYGKVNINSSVKQIGWGTLYPFVESKIIPSVKEINSDVAVIYMEYNIGAQNEYEAYDSYAVNEYYRIRQTNQNMYLLNYEREANQLFDSRNDLTTSSKINLGVTSDTNVVRSASSNGDYLYYVNQGSLWCFDKTNNQFTKAFSFDGDDSDNVRERYDRHDIKILKVADDGSCDFIVDGYMNRGEHEGEVGVSLFSYDYSTNIVSERVYIPLNVPYEVLSQNVGSVAYIGENNVFYVLIDDTLYGIDLTSKEVMTEVSGLKDDTYAVSSSGHAIAYSTNGELNNTDTIRIFNVEKGTDQQIQANDGDKLRVIGFINEDFIYGIAHQSDILIENNGNTTFAMYKVCIMNDNYEEIKSYQQNGVYISEASVSNLRVNLSRVVKDGSGNYESTSEDQLINKDENAEQAGVTVDTISTQTKQQETVLVLPKALSKLDTVNMRTAKEVVFKKNEALEIGDEFTGKGRFYVFGYGRFQGSFLSISSAISKAYETYGSVADYRNDYIWNRYRNTSASLKGITSPGCDTASSLAVSVDILLKNAGVSVNTSEQFAQGKTAVDVINAATEQRALNLKGVSLDHVLNIINAGYPVIARTGTDSYAILTAYDATNVTYIDTASGSTQTKTISEASKTFAQWGNQFLSYYK